MRGLLIAIEGPDGTGRTTQARQLADWLAARERPVQLLRLKGSSLAREALQDLQRRIDISERAIFLLYAADLADLLRKEAAPALAEGQIVLFDRYTLTPTVRAAAHGIDPAWLRDALSFAPTPDLTLLLSAPARERLRRLLARRRFLQPREAGTGRPGQDVLSAALSLQRRLGRLYEEAGEGFGAVRIDAGQPADAVQEEAQLAVQRLLRSSARRRREDA